MWRKLCEAFDNGNKSANNKPHIFDGVFGMAYGLYIRLSNHAVKFRKIKEL